MALFRLLRRYRDSIQVGAAAAIVVLAVMTFGVPQLTLNSLDRDPRDPTTRLAIPQDAAYYREQWIQITEQFYAAHPVTGDEATVATASLSDRIATVTLQSDARVQPAGFVSAVVPAISDRVDVAADSPILNIQPIKARRTAWAGNYAVGIALAIGVFATALFQWLWPIEASAAAQTIEVKGQLRIELPRHWVHIRPTAMQQLKPLVVASSYVASACAAWWIWHNAA